MTFKVLTAIAAHGILFIFIYFYFYILIVLVLYFPYQLGLIFHVNRLH